MMGGKKKYINIFGSFMEPFKYNLLVWYDDSVLISASSVGFAFVLKLHFVDFIKFLLWVVFVDCISVGVVIATTLW